MSFKSKLFLTLTCVFCSVSSFAHVSVNLKEQSQVKLEVKNETSVIFEGFSIITQLVCSQTYSVGFGEERSDVRILKVPTDLKVSLKSPQYFDFYYSVLQSSHLSTPPLLSEKLIASNCHIETSLVAEAAQEAEVFVGSLVNVQRNKGLHDLTSEFHQSLQGQYRFRVVSVGTRYCESKGRCPDCRLALEKKVKKGFLRVAVSYNSRSCPDAH